ncbi:putative F-box/FBD/LRR-repeat protein-like [Capsicum annuum]|nr:putative F-box/FBD/LRR-repeat protein-like [Capsicum annuum]
MYSCSSLITLYLSYVVFDKGLCIAWNSLKSLTLDSTELEDDDIVRLLSSCPALETMEFSCCVGCHRLEMASSNLKTLKLHSHYHLPFVGYGTLEIFAPHLQHFDISGELQKLSCVTELIIGSWLAGNCSTMRSFHFLDPDFLLYSSLAIPPRQLEQSYFDEVDNINLPSWIPNTVFPNFKSVKIASCRTGCLKKWSKGSFCRLFKLFEVSSKECSGFPEACNRCKKEKMLHLFRELCVPAHFTPVRGHHRTSYKSAEKSIVFDQPPACVADKAEIAYLRKMKINSGLSFCDSQLRTTTLTDVTISISTSTSYCGSSSTM